MARTSKLLHIMLLTLLAVLAPGCNSDPEPLGPPSPEDPVLTVKNELPPFSPRGGSAQLLFESNETWNITTETPKNAPNDWFKIAPLSGEAVEAGEEIAVNVTTEANEEYTGRGFTIVLKSKSLEKRIEVTQLKKNIILLGDNRYELSFEQQTLTVNVRSNVEYTISIKKGGDWITEVPESRSLKETQHSFTISANPDEEERTGTIVFKDSDSELSDEITVIQRKQNVILLGDNRYELSFEQQTFTVNVRSNVEYTISIKKGGDWITEVPESRSLKETQHSFTISANPDEEERTGTIVFKDTASGLSEEVTVVQEGLGAEPPDPDRTALKAFYASAGGNGWTRNDNWDSDKPLDEWYGVETDNEGRVIELRLPRNNLWGTISDKIAGLTYLRHIDLSWNEITDDFGFYDKRITRLTELETINLSHNNISGGLPLDWHKLAKLQLLDMSSNQIGAAIPIQWEPMFTRNPMPELILYNNVMNGSVPQAIQNHGEWNRFALQLVRQRGRVGIGGGNLQHDKDYFIPEVTFTSLSDNSQHSSRDIFMGNKLTMIFHWDPLDEASNKFLSTNVRRFHTLFSGQRFAVVGITPEGDQYREAARSYIQQNNVPWLTTTDYEDNRGRRIILADYPYPSYLLVDEYGKVVEDMCPGRYFFPILGIIDDLNILPHTDYLNLVFQKKFGQSEYESTDFSRNKTYETLQTASRGTGIDLLFLGEAFTDIDIETGHYHDIMEFAMESFFLLEPVKSYREYFNVYIVNAVSRKPYIGDNGMQVALGTTPSTNYGVYCNPILLEEYVKVCPIKSFSKSFPSILINDYSVGVTYMGPLLGNTNPSYAFTGYGYGFIKYIMQSTFIHESVGHSFGLLADEYENGWSSGTIPENLKSSLRRAYSYGCCLNVSLSNDPQSVYWSHLIGHQKYSYVGIFEGGYLYEYGVWRSEDNSMMRESRTYPYFNAICRQLTYKRIMELSGGTYSFDSFVAQDSDEGRPGKTSYSILRNDTNEKSPYVHYPPVFIE